MKEVDVHAVMVRALVQSLRDVFAGGYYADKVLERAFKKNRKWGSRDRRFLAETLYDMVRWWGTLTRMDGGSFSPEKEGEYLLRWALYEAWKKNRDVLPLIQKSFPDARLPFKTAGQIKERLESTRLEPWDEVSFPRWLFEKFQGDYGEETKNLLNALNDPAPVVLRVNSLKADRNTVAALLEKEGILTRPVESVAEGLVLIERKNVFATKAFKDGLFEVQDGASQKVAPLLEPKSGERVADVCAGAGGKTLHLAALMKNKGTILASDVSERKLEQLKLRARRAGVSNLRIQHFDGNKTVKRHAEKFEGVLIDAPCSGSGVIRRNCDTKWKLNPEEFTRLLELQSEILDRYSKLVAPGGRLVYATCSLFTEENEGQVEAFLRRHGDFEKSGEALKTRPDRSGEDGFFAQRLVRKK